MQANMWKITATLALATAVSAAVVAGCDEKSQQNLKEKAAEAQNKASQVAGDAMAKAREGFESLKTQYAPQIDELSSQLATLKSQAMKFKDTQLDGYLSQLDTKISEIKSKLGGTLSQDAVTSLKDNMGKWMDEAKGLYEKASARVAELTKSAAPTPPAPGG